MPRAISPSTRKLPVAKKQGAASANVSLTTLPLLPIRDNVHFPHVIFPLFVGREKSVLALDAAMAGSQHILLVPQRHIAVEDPEPEDLYEIGLIAEIMQILKVPDGTVRVMLEGIERGRIHDFHQIEPYFEVAVQRLPDRAAKGLKTEALMRSVTAQFEQIASSSKSVPPEAVVAIISAPLPGELADQITWHLSTLRMESKQELLETLDPQERLEKLSVVLKKEYDILEIQKDIRSRVEKEMGDTQREFFLREQLKAIHQELGERDDRQTEIEEYRSKLAASGMSSPQCDAMYKEIDRLERIPYGAPEGTIIRNYLDMVVSLPWAATTPETLDINEAESILEDEHYGLAKVKERILEFLAVRQLTGSLKGPILCFVGPPGVGKTSLGKSIAHALGRKFHRISLGGIRDEAEIRGHRRTYIGAMPGRIIQGLKQTGVRNPVFMLDELDKMGSDYRGDPSSALLEALDPEQNREFSDHYLESTFDLSDVMFITTANLLDNIPPALRDRMEVISFSGYTEDEKLEIARRFLLPKQIKENGVADAKLVFPEATLRKIIREHTHEAGVRNLERELAAICRKIARQVAKGEKYPKRVTEADLHHYLGARKCHYGVMEDMDGIGMATGLVYTESGGDVMTIEVLPVRGKEGRLILTGQLGDVMKESAQTALSYVRSWAHHLSIDEGFFEHTELHIHVPAGAIPKDGPSAGITMATALASAISRRPVRSDIAMTGEITLRGRVLPIGGLKEKVLAAHRAGIRIVVMPQENERDLEEIPENVRHQMTFRPVTNADEVLRFAMRLSEP